MTAAPVQGGPPRVSSEGTLTSFELAFAGVLIVRFDEIKFETRPGEQPKLTLDGLEVEFEGDLRFLDVLHEAVAMLGAVLLVAIAATQTQITVHQHVGLDRISIGVRALYLTTR